MPPCARSGELKLGKKILVAEGNDSNYVLFLHVLKDYDFTRTKNGVEAVDAGRNGNWDYRVYDQCFRFR